MSQGETISPFDGDAEPLDQEIAWLGARARRFAAELRQEEDEDNALTSPDGEWRSRSSDESAEHITNLREREVAVRADIEARLAASEGWVPSLDAACDEHGLSEHERLVLLAAVLPCLGDRVVQGAIGCLDSYVVSSVTPDTVMVLCDAKTAAERLGVRAMLGPDSRLVRAGLVEVELPKRENGPAALIQASVWITDAGYPAVLGHAVGEPAA